MSSNLAIPTRFARLSKGQMVNYPQQSFRLRVVTLRVAVNSRHPDQIREVVQRTNGESPIAIFQIAGRDTARGG